MKYLQEPYKFIYSQFLCRDQCAGLCWTVSYILYGFRLWYMYTISRPALWFCPELCSSVCPKCMHVKFWLRILPRVMDLYSLGGNQHTGKLPGRHFRRLPSPICCWKQVPQDCAESEDYITSSGNLCHLLFTIFMVKKCFLKRYVLYFTLGLLPPLLSQGISEKTVSPFHPLTGCTLVSYP